MNTGHAELQPQDPFAAKLGIYISRFGIAVAIALALFSIFRG
jgi:hypothetical protein